MKKLIIIIAAVAFSASMFSSCGNGPVKLRSEADSVAYFIGYDVGENLKEMESSLDVKMLTAALNKVFSEKPMEIDRDSAVMFLNEYFNVRVPERTKKEGEAFLEKIEAENRNVQKTESGLLYEIIEAGDQNIKATKNEDRVKVFYRGTLRNGVEFDTSYNEQKEQQDTVEFMLAHVIKGWSEGMKLVGKGGQIKLYVPTDLAYGRRGRPGIKPNEPLVFDVTLVDVVPAVEEEQE